MWGRVWLVSLAVIAGCTTAGDSPFSAVEIADAAVDPDAEPGDAAPPDAASCETLTAPQIGAPCTDNNECGPANVPLCLNGAFGWPADGYCTRQCTSDADCGAGARCSPDLDEGPGTFQVCLANCCGVDDCGRAGHVCQPSLLGNFLADNACLPADPTAGDGAACASFGDCPPEAVCLSNPFNFPGGYCLSLGCDVATDAGCAPTGTSECVMVAGADTVCFDACAAGPECRTAEGYVCVDPDQGGPLGSVCTVGSPGVGAACASDPACGPSPWTCLQGASFPGGDCGAALGTCDPLDANTCPDGSVCHSPSGQVADRFCARRCNPAQITDCRTVEGYSCTNIGTGVDVCLGP